MSEENTENTEAKPHESNTKSEFVSVKEYERLQSQFNDLSNTYKSVNSKLESFGNIDPEKLQEIMSENQTFKKQEATGDPEKIEQLLADQKSEIESRLLPEIEKWKGEASKASDSLNEHLVVNSALNSISKHFNDDCLDDARRMIRESVRKDSEGFFVVDADGKEVYDPEDRSKRLSLDSWIDLLREKKPSFFKSKSISKGAMQSGQTKSSSGSVDVGSVDIDRFKSDLNYRNSFSRSERYRIAREYKI